MRRNTYKREMKVDFDSFEQKSKHFIQNLPYTTYRFRLQDADITAYYCKNIDVMIYNTCFIVECVCSPVSPMSDEFLEISDSSSSESDEQTKFESIGRKRVKCNEIDKRLYDAFYDLYTTDNGPFKSKMSTKLHYFSKLMCETLNEDCNEFVYLSSKVINLFKFFKNEQSYIIETFVNKIIEFIKHETYRDLFVFYIGASSEFINFLNRKNYYVKKIISILRFDDSLGLSNFLINLMNTKMYPKLQNWKNETFFKYISNETKTILNLLLKSEDTITIIEYTDFLKEIYDRNDDRIDRENKIKEFIPFLEYYLTGRELKDPSNYTCYGENKTVTQTYQNFLTFRQLDIKLISFFNILAELTITRSVLLLNYYQDKKLYPLIIQFLFNNESFSVLHVSIKNIISMVLHLDAVSYGNMIISYITEIEPGLIYYGKKIFSLEHTKYKPLIAIEPIIYKLFSEIVNNKTEIKKTPKKIITYKEKIINDIKVKCDEFLYSEDYLDIKDFIENKLQKFNIQKVKDTNNFSNYVIGDSHLRYVWYISLHQWQEGEIFDILNKEDTKKVEQETLNTR